MSHDVYIGIDNGVSGSIGVLWLMGNAANKMPDLFIPTPTFSSLNYTKKARNVTRVDVPALRRVFMAVVNHYDEPNVLVVLESPMINPGRFNATASALRAFEATMICIESVQRALEKRAGWAASLSYMTTPSRSWQKVMLPNVKGNKELKRASAQIGCSLFNKLAPAVKVHGDADGLLIAEWARRALL